MDEKRETGILSRDFVCGLIVGEGCFSVVYHKRERRFVPTFEIRMHVRDKDLITDVMNSIGLNTWVHEYIHAGRHYAGFIVRDHKTLLNVVIPYFRDHLTGYKKFQFDEWANFIEVMEEIRINKRIQKLSVKHETV